MSVISTLISRSGTVHATDSLITRFDANGRRKPEEPEDWNTMKIVPVEAWRGAMSYYGLALTDSGWSTLDWLRQQAAVADRYESAELFAKHIAAQLNQVLSRIVFRVDTDAGI